MPRIPHDELFRHTFEQPEHAAALFRLVLPPTIVAAIDWSTLDLFHEILRAPSGKESLDALLSYLIRATPLEPERLLEVLWHKADKEIHMRFKSTALQLHERGKVEGKAEGLTEGLSAILIDLLTTRFGTIPHPLTSRIRAATPDQLQSWARRCLDAASIDDVFADG